jgi:hypothetical protein
VDDHREWDAALSAPRPSGAPGALLVAQQCVAHLAVSGAGVSVVTASGVREIVCSTDAIAEQLETLQFTLGVGPCVDAGRQRSPVLVSDVARPDGVSVARWPALVDAMLASGVRALFAFPLGIGAIGLGAMDLYRDEPGPLSSAQLSGALAAADAVTLCLLRRDGVDEDDGAASLSPRFAIVHQATGMVQAQLDVPIEQAFLLLRARAFATDRPVVDLARDVVERRLRFSQEDV